GTGQLAALLLDQGVEQYVGLDRCEDFVARAAATVSGGTFVTADACSTDIYTWAEHEAVVCTEVLEHVPDDLAIVSRILPGKRCYGSVPNFPYRNAHVRYFEDARAVATRYGPFFRDFDVMTLKSPRSATDLFFLFEGVRNENGAPT